MLIFLIAALPERVVVIRRVVLKARPGFILSAGRTKWDVRLCRGRAHVEIVDPKRLLKVFPANPRTPAGRPAHIPRVVQKPILHTVNQPMIRDDTRMIAAPVVDSSYLRAWRTAVDRREPIEIRTSVNTTNPHEASGRGCSPRLFRRAVVAREPFVLAGFSSTAWRLL